MHEIKYLILEAHRSLALSLQQSSGVLSVVKGFAGLRDGAVSLAVATLSVATVTAACAAANRVTGRVHVAPVHTATAHLWSIHNIRCKRRGHDKGYDTLN